MHHTESKKLARSPQRAAPFRCWARLRGRQNILISGQPAYSGLCHGPAGLLLNAGNIVTISRQGILLPRQRLPIDVTSILSKKGTDPFLQPNDILYIPDSGSKKTLEAMARITKGGAIGVAMYKLGL
jgi:hypothetical protein